MKTYSYLFLSFGLFGCATAVGDPSLDFVGSGGNDTLATGGAPASGAAPGVGTGSGGTTPGGTGGALTTGGTTGATGGGTFTPTGGGSGTFDGPAVSFMESGSAGDVLLFDDFEMGAGTWYPNTAAPWSLVADESQALQQGFAVDDTMFVVGGSSTWSNVYVEARVKMLSGSDSDDIAAVAVRFSDLNNFYYVAFQGDGAMKLRKRSDGSNSSIGTTYNDANLALNTWYTIGIEAVGTKINMYLDGVLVQEEDDIEKYSADDSDLTTGYAGVGTLANATAVFDDVRVVQK